MNSPDLDEIYREYIACLNSQDWQNLACFVSDEVVHNGRRLGLSGYRSMLVHDFEQIPGLHFSILLLVCEPPHVAARLAFDCAPKGTFLGLDVNGRQVSFTENVFYRFQTGKITEVWAVIDKAAIEVQLIQ